MKGKRHNIYEVSKMEQLAQMNFTPLQGNEKALSDAEIAASMRQLPDWTLVESGGIKRVQRAFAFDTFMDALAFTNSVGELAEIVGHHPAILTEWGKTTVTWWTHSLGGLHLNDLIMAARTDQLYAG
jgi:4a-hydroxytetrahydrobiopterin dehydratase